MFETYGYPVESHQIQTQDGYILTLCRVPTGKLHPDVVNERALPKVSLKSIRPAVLLVHGFISSGDLWFTNTPDKSLPFLLVDEGYDCWVLNLRGTPLSKSHVCLQNDSQEFWDFSYHEMGLFDAPAAINYILETTGNQNLVCIGHSMGCAVLFVLLSLKSEYCTKVKLMVALTPAVYLKNIRSKFARYLFIPMGFYMGLSSSIYRREVFKTSRLELAKAISPRFCSAEKISGWLLNIVGYWVGEFGKDQIEPSRLPVVAAVYPLSSSLKIVVHGNQCYNADTFQQFDYGRTANMKKYGQLTPPTYDLKKVHVPVVTFYSDGDELCTSLDVIRLSEELPDVIGQYGIAQPNFGHTDFVVGKDAVIVYKKIISIIRTS